MQIREKLLKLATAVRRTTGLKTAGGTAGGTLEAEAGGARDGAQARRGRAVEAVGASESERFPAPITFTTKTKRSLYY